MAASPSRPSSARPGRAGFDYRRRNLLPAVLVVVVLAVASVVTWTVVLTNSTSSEVTACNAPTVPATGGPVARTALDDTPAASPGDVAVRVLNGAGQRGQGQLAAVELGELGIAEAAPPDNDPLYPAQDLSCVGQIRYGPASAPAARTLSLVVPCAELVDDGRPTATVDLALGSDFRDITPSAGAADAVRALARGSAEGAPAAGTDPATLTGLHDVDCST